MKTILHTLIFLFINYSYCGAQNGLTFHPYPSNYTLTELRYINDVKIDAQLNVWVAFRYIGLGKYNGSGWTFYDTINSNIPSKNVLSISIDNQNNLWAGTEKGLAKFDGVTWTIFDSINSGLPGSVVFAVKNYGNIVWCGTNFGLSKFDGSNWSTFNNQNSGITGDSVRFLETGMNGELWIGTSNMGVSKFYYGSWINFNSSNSTLPSFPVRKILIDANNNTWIDLGPNFLFKITKQTVVDYFKDIYSGVIEPFNNFYSIVKNTSGHIILPGYIPSWYFSLNEIKGNEIAMTTCNTLFQLAPGASFNTKSTSGSDNLVWLATVAVSNGIYGLLSFDKNKFVPAPFELTNENSKLLDINGVEAAVLNRGDMHWDLKNSRYEVPKGSGLHSVYASALWLGGIDDGAQLHLSAQRYRQNGNDIWPGPIDTVTGLSDSATSILYDKMWKINRATIQDFKINFKNGSVTNGSYPIPDEIISWPAHGTGNITRDLAPFVDFNGDGLYNPVKGDYPLIKGDQMLYWIINDNLSTHTETSGLPLGVEIHCSAYAYTCDQLSDSEAVMHNTTIYHYSIINRSNQNYHDFLIGLWCDTDLGNAIDDYIGCDTVLNAGFAYNGDNDDENSYGLNPPMQNIKILSGPIADIGDNKDNDHDGTIDEQGEQCLMSGFMKYWKSGNTPTDIPHSAADFYNYLNTKWLDGNPLTYGGYGYNPPGPGTIPTKYMFSGTPYDSSITEWTEASTGNLPEDRDFFLVSGPFTLPSGEEKTIDFAYVFSRDSSAPNGLHTSIAKNKRDLQKIQNWFDNNNFPSCLVINIDTGVVVENITPFSLFPNPAKDIISILGFDANTTSTYEIVDVTGRLVKSGTLKQNTLSIFELSNAIYLIQIKNENQFWKTKFIKE